MAIRNTLSKQLKFATGVISEDSQKLMQLERTTVWLSDDTMIKQVDSRAGQSFGIEYYQRLPNLIDEPDRIFKDGRNFTITKQYGDEMLLAVIKLIEGGGELFLQSYRISNLKEVEKLAQKLEVLK